MKQPIANEYHDSCCILRKTTHGTSLTIVVPAIVFVQQAVTTEFGRVRPVTAVRNIVRRCWINVRTVYKTKTTPKTTATNASNTAQKNRKHHVVGMVW